MVEDNITFFKSRYETEAPVKSLDDLFSKYFTNKVFLSEFRTHSSVSDPLEIIGQGLVSESKSNIGYLFILKDNNKETMDFYLTIYGDNNIHRDVNVKYNFINFEDPTFKMYVDKHRRINS